MHVKKEIAMRGIENKLAMIGLSIATTCLPSAARAAVKDEPWTAGVNWAGAEFAGNTLPGVEGTNFFWPTLASLDYYAAKGIKLIRVPFSWERLQPALGGPLDPTYLGRLKDTVKAIGDRGMKCVIDMHNYNRYRQKLIGSPEVPREDYRQVWTELAKVFKGNAGVWGYGLMNEPYESKGSWPANAQAAVDGVRSVDSETLILLAGEFFSSTRNWLKYNGDLHKQVHDPADNMRFEGHFYFDHDSSGQYRQGYEKEMDLAGPSAGTDIGVERLKPFIKWLKDNHLKGYVGEYGVPAGINDDPRWLEAMDNALAFMKANDLPCTYWSAGTFWAPGDTYACEPKNGQDSPQIKTILKFLNAAK